MEFETPSSQLKKLITAGFTTPSGGFKGCSETEIDALEKHFTVVLPKTYKDFLRVCGKDAGGLLNFCLYQYFDLTQFIEPHLADLARKFDLPTNHFVFVWDNDIILYFDTAGGDDPPVWRYDEVENKREQVFDSFSAWFSDHVSVNLSEITES